MADHPLTEKEQRCIAMLAEAANLYQSVCMEPYKELCEESQRNPKYLLPGETIPGSRLLYRQAQNDWAEAAAVFHVLQKALMGQAAARIYPTNYRLLGGVLHAEHGAEQKEPQEAGRTLVEEPAGPGPGSNERGPQGGVHSQSD